MLKKSIGLEAEFLLIGEDGNPVIVPEYIGRDDFPLLGEVRGEPGDSIGEVVGNFLRAYHDVIGRIPSGHTASFTPFTIVGSEIYRKALKESGPKKVSKTRNVNGTDITGLSDLVIRDGKITGAKISCGLHVHFSATDRYNTVSEEPKYESVILPLSAGDLSLSANLYRRCGYNEERKIDISVSALTKPSIDSIVTAMDEKFAHLMPSKVERTKYRRPGYFELKPWGFEYRSLPTTKDNDTLSDIVRFAFCLLDDLYYQE